MGTKYIKLEVKGPKYATIIAKCRRQFKNQYPDNVMHINKNQEGTFSWVKVLDTTEIPEAIAIANTKAQHGSRVLPDVTNAAWRPEQA